MTAKKPVSLASEMKHGRSAADADGRGGQEVAEAMRHDLRPPVDESLAERRRCGDEGGELFCPPAIGVGQVPRDIGRERWASRWWSRRTTRRSSRASAGACCSSPPAG
jgi:hypothetical protein